MKFPFKEVKIGHWTDAEAKTGCTVIRFPNSVVASGEVRGGAPATREFELLSPERTVENINAVTISGGSGSLRLMVLLTSCQSQILVFQLLQVRFPLLWVCLYMILE